MDVRRKMKQEMRHYFGHQGTTIIVSSVEVENFSFDSLWYEMSSHVPTLTTVLQQLMPNKDFSLNIPVLYLIGSILLKHRSQNMALLQRVISVVLYGNGASKQVSYWIGHINLHVLCSTRSVWFVRCIESTGSKPCLWGT